MQAEKVLILLDMNETLILRRRYIIKCQTSPNLRAVKNVYFRPGYDDLLYKLLTHPRAVVAIYSSMVMESIKFCMDGMMGSERLVPLKDRLSLYFDKRYNAKDTSKAKKTATMRDLKKVWEDPKCMAAFGEKNTIVIDNDHKKIRMHKENAIVVDSFAPEHLINCKPNNRFYLNELGDYLRKLLDDYKGDIREQLKEEPFKVDSEQYNTVDTRLKESGAQEAI
eukprot:TRINITY_DN8430_c0_g1_i1.p1 TRINITY_DN8430_c0_g1~~TRINITY_DN8430_c0_g1_i1.p1  ORF type:complete len:223 (+),score=67.97 TRINITY_DN8430_c0_g1_i1:181-849(+)